MSIPTDELLSICSAVGFITINWALMERQLDSCIYLIHTDLGGVEGHIEKPRAFKKKTNYLHKAFTHITELNQYKDNALKLVKMANTISYTRNNFTHGTIEKLDDTVLTINTLNLKDGYRSESRSFDFKQFPKLAGDLEDLVTQWTHLSADLLDNLKLLKQEYHKHH